MHNNCGGHFYLIINTISVNVLCKIFVKFYKNFEKLYFIKYLYKKKLLYIL